MSALVCWNCGENLDDIPRPISRHANCPKCFNELHCCRLCRHNDPNASMTCFEDRADPPLQKENANFCDFFVPRFGAFENKTADKSASARSNLDALFSDASDEIDDTRAAPNDVDQALSKDEQAKKRLDDLFN